MRKAFVFQAKMTELLSLHVVFCLANLLSVSNLACQARQCSSAHVVPGAAESLTHVLKLNTPKFWQVIKVPLWLHRVLWYELFFAASMSDAMSDAFSYEAICLEWRIKEESDCDSWKSMTNFRSILLGKNAFIFSCSDSVNASGLLRGTK